MPSIREPEELGARWSKIYSHGFGGFGVFLSLLTMSLLIIWIMTPDGGGLGLRQSVNTTDYFNWHPVLMGVAFLGLMTPATSAFETYSPLSRSTNKNIHALLQTTAIIVITAGYIIIWDCHTVLGDHGLALSMHSIAGYMTMSLVGLTYLMGFVLYVLKFGGTLRGDLKPFHKRLGFLSLLMGYATILMGMTEKANSLTGNSLVFAQVIVGLTIGVALSISFSIVKFVDKKQADFKYAAIPDDVDTTVQLM
mmetsp:Transcript_56501/g.50834  ORF Transcript_56501/g.50834 Transcript_56501/m.50834 type:complete len:251 (-) Transcript_56501:242-994(-)